jgi:hypothetical protein
MKKIGIKGIIVLIFECCALVFLILCIATDLNDDLFLPLSLGCVCIGSAINLVIQKEMCKKDKKHENDKE